MKLKHKSAQHDPNFKENLISHCKEEEMSVFLLGRGFDPVALILISDFQKPIPKNHIYKLKVA